MGRIVPHLIEDSNRGNMTHSDEVAGRIGALPDDYLIVHRSGAREPIAYLRRATGGEVFRIAGAYQGGVLGAFVLRIIPMRGSASSQQSLDVPVITMEQYGESSLPLLLESTQRQGHRGDFDESGLLDIVASRASATGEPSVSKVTILGHYKKRNDLWRDSIVGVLHDRDGHHYFVVTRTTDGLSKICFPFLQDKFGQVWHIRGQRVQGWLKKVLVVELVSAVGLRRTIYAIATQDALDKPASSAIRWAAVAEQCHQSVAEAPVAGIFAGMRGDFFWHPSDPDRLIAESNNRVQASARIQQR
jgi:hypothetical protein